MMNLGEKKNFKICSMFKKCGLRVDPLLCDRQASMLLGKHSGEKQWLQTLWGRLLGGRHSVWLSGLAGKVSHGFLDYHGINLKS